LFTFKSDSGKKPSWVEPLKDWIKTTHNAGKLLDSSADLFEIKSISEKIGTKRLLLDKKIGLELVPAYALASKDRVLQLKGTKSPAKAGQIKSGKKNEHLAWRSLKIYYRTLFGWKSINYLNFIGQLLVRINLDFIFLTEF
jgi:hypothetical protein